MKKLLRKLVRFDKRFIMDGRSALLLLLWFVDDNDSSIEKATELLLSIDLLSSAMIYLFVCFVFVLFCFVLFLLLDTIDCLGGLISLIVTT